MDLQEFIKTALVEIVAGVAEARDIVNAHGAVVGSVEVYGHTKEAKIITDKSDRPITSIEFDIALAEASAQETKGGIGVFLGPVTLGTQGESHGESSSHSRIKFAVPVIFPGTNG